MRTRDPLDPLQPHEVPRGPHTPWLWIVLTLVGLAVLLWMLLSLANQPDEGAVREGAAHPHARPLTSRSPGTSIGRSPWESCQRLRSIHPQGSEQG